MSRKTSTDSPQPDEATVGVTDLMRAAGLKNRRTLNRWCQKRAIPGPTVELHPSGRGRRSTWPAWVEEHCRTVRQLTDGGQTLEQVVATFGTDWPALERRYGNLTEQPPQRRKVKLSMQPVSEERLIAAINVKLAAAIGSARKQLQSTQLPTLTAELEKRAIDLFCEGFNPVLLVAPPRAHVVADFQVSNLLSEAVVETSYFLIPLAETISEALDGKSRPRKRTVCPAQKVVVRESGEEREVTFKPLTNLSFAIETE